MLAALLAQHPDVSGLANTGVYMNEGQFLQTVYSTAPALQPGFYALEKDAHLTELGPEEAASAAEGLLTSWSPYWQRPNARLLLEKSPPNMLRSRFLGSVFPNSLQIFVLRDPIVVGLATQKWSYTSLTACVDHTIKSYRILFDDLHHVRSNWIVVRYESLAADPGNVASYILNALGLNADALPVTALKRVKPASNEEYLQSLDAPEFAAGRVRVFHRSRRWLRANGFELTATAREITYVRKAFAVAIAELGYAADTEPLAIYSAFDELPDLHRY